MISPPLSWKNSTICFWNLSSKKQTNKKPNKQQQQTRLLKRESTRSLAVQKDHLLRKTLEGRQAKFPCRAKADECQAGSHPACSSGGSVLQQLEWRRNCPLAPIVNIPHKQWPSSLSIVHSVFICESPLFIQCAKPFFSQAKF